MDFLGNYGRVSSAPALGNQAIAKKLAAINPSTLSELGMGMTPGVGDAMDVAYLGGYTPKFNSPHDIIPSGYGKTAPSLPENISQGNYFDAAVQGLAPIVPFASAAALKTGAAAIPMLGMSAGNSADALKTSKALPNKTGPSDAPNLLPAYQGAAPDRSTQSLLRYMPKNESPRFTAAKQNLSNNSNGVKTQMDSDIKRGLEMGGADWYNTEELRDWFIDRLGAERGHNEWAEYMDIIGATSTGSKVPANIKNSSYYRNKGPQWIADNIDDLAGKGPLTPPKGSGYGHKMQQNHAWNVGSLNSGKWSGLPEPDVSPAKGSWTLNPKPRGFANSLKGNPKNIAADLHFTRYMAWAANDPAWLDNAVDIGADMEKKLRSQYGDAVEPYLQYRGKGDKKFLQFKPKAAVADGAVPFDAIKDEIGFYVGKPSDGEYGGFEELTNALGKEHGLTGAQYQAALWMGAADRTGVDPTSQGTFMDLFRRQLDKTAKKTKRTADEVLDDFIVNRGKLALGAGVGTAATLGATREDRPRLGQTY
jgi:hypothetical protein